MMIVFLRFDNQLSNVKIKSCHMLGIVAYQYSLNLSDVDYKFFLVKPPISIIVLTIIYSLVLL